MQNQTILVLQGPTGTDAELEYLADAVREQDAHLSVLHVGPIKPIPTYAYGGMPYGAVEVPNSWIEERRKLANELAEKRKDTNAFFDKQGLSGEAGVICTFPSSLDDEVAPRAMFCDVAVLHNDLREDDDAYTNLLYGLLFKSPVGVIINPQTSKKPLNPDTVFVAWNNSKPSARAVHQALPMLKAAKKVIIGTFDAIKKPTRDGEEPGADIAKWLSHHGCKVTVQQHETNKNELGSAIIDRARQEKANIVVMGAYGHTRLRQAVFGGTTRSMTEQTDMAVFLAH